jgi:hypothetical protein
LIPENSTIFFSSENDPDQFWGPSNLPFDGCWVFFFVGKSGWEMKLTI